MRRSARRRTTCARSGPLPPADATLPAVAVVLQVASEGPLVDTFLDGEPLGTFDPFVLDEAALYRGRLTNGAYDWPGVRNVTAVYQEPALAGELRERHGRDLRFAGIVLAPGYLDGAEQKRRAAEASAALVAGLGADGVVCTTFSSGNSHTDTMLTVQACERRGIATVALVCETNGGLTDHVPEADCLVSTGNEDELVDAWTPERVIGGDGARPHRRARAAVHYLGGARADRRRPMDGGARMTVVHYVNQFFAGLGGEEAAGHEPVRLDGPQGPGRGLAAAGLAVDVTLACGDDFFGEHESAALDDPARLARRAPRPTCSCAGRRSAPAATATRAACSRGKPAAAASRWSRR